MAALAASLRADPSLEVICLDASTAQAATTLNTLDSIATLFDLSDPPPGVDITLLCERPRQVLVGIDAQSDRILVLSGRQERPVSAAELVHVILGGSASP
jgi:hypothetical protein